ncbi:MAG: DUF2236 domain-containing protein [Cyclobacteriaceae bacterium]
MESNQLSPDAFNSISESLLNEKRLKKDPLADNVVAKIISSGYEEKINEVFMALVRNDSYDPSHFSSLPEEIFKIVTNYFEQTSELPDWANSDLIQEGERVFGLYGPEIFMLLNVKSLPLCYTCGKGAKVLFITGRLTEKRGDIDPLARRLMETAQMILNAMSPGGLKKGGAGIITLQKVRLIHASIRYFLTNEKYNKKGWDANEFGEPINQEDLAGTLMSFGPIILSGLSQLNISLSSHQKEAYMHCWKVIGHIMGLDEDLLPDTYEQGWALTKKILTHQSIPSSDGVALTESCIGFMQYMIPGNLLNKLPAYMIWYFFQDISKAVEMDLAAMIGISTHEDKKDHFIMILTRLITGAIGKLEHSEIIKKLTLHYSKILLQAFLKHYNEGKDVHFFIPPSLQKDWKLTEEWTDKVAITPDILGNRLMWQKKEEGI